MADSPGEPTDTWFDVADELFDEGVEREEAVRLRAEDLTVDVPLTFGDDDREAFARWRFDGDVTVRMDGMRRSVAEWAELFGEPPDRSGEE